MKKIFAKIIILIFSLNALSCSTLIQLKKNLSEDVISSIRPNSYPISYNFTSDIPETIKENNLDINFNSYFKSNIDEYMKTKFSNIKNDKMGRFISFSIKNVSFSKQYNSNNNFPLIDFFNKEADPIRGHADFSCRIVINVQIYENFISLENKQIVSDYNYSLSVKESNKMSYDYEGYQKATDMNISKSIMLINNYLSSVYFF